MLRYALCLVSLALYPCDTQSDDTLEKTQSLQQALQGDDAKRAADLQKRSLAKEQADEYDEAIKLADELLTLRTKAQGADHWESMNQRWEVERLRKLAARGTEDRAAWRKALQGSIKAQFFDAQAKFAQAEPLWTQFVQRCQDFLGEQFPVTARSYNQLGMHFYLLGKYADAQPYFQKSADIQRELLGTKHPDSANALNNLAVTINAQGKYAEAEPLLRKTLAIQLETLGEKQLATATSYNNLAVVLGAQAKYAEAERLLQKALDIRLSLLGRRHPDVAASYVSLAVNLLNLGRSRDAEPLLRRALDIQQKRFGEKHPEIAKTYHNLAYCLKAQGKYADAEALARRALAMVTELYADNHPDASLAYNNLAFILDAQARYAEAQPLLEKGLAIQLKLLGAKHSDTATSYNNLAHNLHAQGKFSEAQEFYGTALEIQRGLLGESHPSTILTYNNLAGNLESQQDYAKAAALLEKALALRLKLLGETHPDTITSYNNLAHNLGLRGNHAGAEPLLTKVLDLRRESLGEKHPDTAVSYNNLASNYYSQGKLAEARPLFQRALDLRRETLGERHPALATAYHNLAQLLIAQRQFGDALPLLERAAAIYEAARLEISQAGFGRAVFGADRSPYPFLAAMLARSHASSAAWLAAETNLARGFNDELAARRGALNADENQRRFEIAARLHELRGTLAPLVAGTSLSEEETKQLNGLRQERDELERELTTLAVTASQREIASLAEAQRALPDDAALLFWIDAVDLAGKHGEHWGCVLRRTGEPMWEPLHEDDDEGASSADDSHLPRRLAAAAAGSASAAEIDELSRRLRAQRLAPLEKHLAGVRRLYIVPVGGMAGVPVELFCEPYVASYIPSGTLVARLNARPRSDATKLLAVGDPVLRNTPTASPPPLPSEGLLMSHVFPDGNAEKSGLKPDDVLLKYAGSSVASFEQLGKLIQQHQQDASLEVHIWREGETLQCQVRPGKLGVVIDRQPAAEATAARRKTANLLAGLRGDWSELPGTAIELAKLKGLAGGDDVTLLTRSQASEQELERLRGDGRLTEFRYLHFATHGEPNNAKAFESALILSQDHVSADVPPEGGDYYDGRLTAAEVLENWKLNADLVTLSACESALGRPGGGDGLLGFAQAFLLAGARSVCLSLWKVDDTATALLMDRFYQNLLGKREALSQPMPKAEALAEAKRWLRDLPFDKAEKLTAEMAKGVVRGKGEPALALAVPRNDSATPDDRPFAHPRYWAAFIVIGDPN